MIAEVGTVLAQKAKEVLENNAELIVIMAERISYGFYNDEDR